MVGYPHPRILSISRGAHASAVVLTELAPVDDMELVPGGEGVHQRRTVACVATDRYRNRLCHGPVTSMPPAESGACQESLFGCCHTRSYKSHFGGTPVFGLMPCRLSLDLMILPYRAQHGSHCRRRDSACFCTVSACHTLPSHPCPDRCASHSAARL